MSDIILQRERSTKLGTPGKLFFGDSSVLVVEDVVREPERGRPVDPKLLDAWVRSWKIDGVTAIPAGRYLLAWTWSNTFKKFTLQAINVPGFGGIRIHSGNTSKDTRGCIIPGLSRDPNGTDVLASRNAVPKVEDYVRRELEEGVAAWLDVRNVAGWGF